MLVPVASETRNPLRASSEIARAQQGAQAGGDQQRAKLGAVQPDGMGLIIQARAADMRGPGMLQQLFLHRVPVEPGDRAQPPGDGRPGTAARFQIAGEAFDIRPARLEQAQVVLLAPGRVLAQIQRIRLPGQAGVTGQEPSQGEPFGLVNTGSTAATAVDVDVVAMGHLPGRAEAREGWARRGPSDDASKSPVCRLG
jgi:hypothetical protein